MTMEWIILLFTFFTAFLLVLGISSLTGIVRQPVDERIQRWDSTPRRDSTSAFRRTRSEDGVLASLGKRVAPRKLEERNESLTRLRRAGFYGDFAFHVYWAC